DVPNISLILNGVGGTNTLNGPNQVNSWTLNARNGGVLDNKNAFQGPGLFDGFQNLARASAGDRVTLSSAFHLAMNLFLNSTSAVTTSSGTQYFDGAINNNSNTLIVDGHGNTTINGVISGSGGLNKQGSGILTLSAANTYNGTTTISGGTLIVTGSLAASGMVAVDAGAVLEGTGS